MNQTKTLAERLGEGRLPVPEALGYAMQLADSLRKLHDAGKAHGAVTPANVVLAPGGVELLPAAEGSAGAITPYTAPEVVQGRPADQRSDIFSLGAVLFEMLTGRRAFEGESRVILAANLSNAPTPSSGSPLVDRLVVPCLSKNPDARSPRMQRVIMELKMLSVAARRADMGSAAVHKRESAADIGAVREEMQQLEARLAARLQAQEKSVSEVQRSASETENSLKAQMAVMSGELAANVQEAAQRTAGELDKAAAEAILASVDKGLEGLEARLAERLQAQENSASEAQRSASETESSLKAHMAAMSAELATDVQQAAQRTATELDKAASEAILARVDKGFEGLEARIAQMERTLEELRGHTTQFEHNMAADLVDLEQSLKVQSAAIESARTAMSQTDDLVERVVEALESLQMAVMDQGEAGEHSSFAVN
ncbi:MAG: protein kinase [Candidatus Solibacter sp.]